MRKWLFRLLLPTMTLHEREILDIIAQHAPDLPTQREQNAQLADRVMLQKRELDWRAGEKIEPMAHEASCVMRGAIDTSFR